MASINDQHLQPHTASVITAARVQINTGFVTDYKYSSTKIKIQQSKHVVMVMYNKKTAPKALLFMCGSIENE